MLRFIVALLCFAAASHPVIADDGNRLAYLDECNPWHPHKDFPKLITPQWVGEDGVEAVIVLGIDDMRDPAKYEQYLRPILNRLKQIDGRAPVSIMTCEVKPDDPQLQSWLGEGLSIECHTIDHPCPILQGGNALKKVSGTLEVTEKPDDNLTPESSRHLFQPFAKAKSTYDRCVDLMGKIPGNKPVAFRTPCCDSLNTVSPRFFAEIFDSTTENGNFLQIDSSVFTFFTSEDESLPRELVLDANGKDRFLKYMPRGNKTGNVVHNNFVNTIKNYPYPYVINNTCWEIPCIAPSDWSAQHLHGINNPVTVEDWKAAIDLTVHKQGCFSLVFHPHGWIKPEQVVEMIDHAVAKHGKKVKFLTFGEVAERLNRAMSDGTSLRVTSARSPAFVKSRASDVGKLSQEIIDFLATPTHPKMWPIRRTDGTNNGFFSHDRHFCWQNEDTAHLPDFIYRVSFDEILEEHKKASGRASALREHGHGEQEQNALGGLTPIRSPEHPPVPVGAAVVDITPYYPVRLTGYGSRMKESEGVAARIHARALVVGDSASGRASALRESAPGQTRKADALLLTVLITVDTCAVPSEVTEKVFARVAEKHGLTRERFAISSTHSHSAPWLRDFAPNIFAEIPDDHAAHLAQYEAELIEKLVEVVDKAIAARRPGYLSSGFGETNFAMNRRLLSGGKWANFGEVPDGPTDKRVPVLAAHDTDGKLIAVLANYACHCTTETGDFNQISGDWAGFAADMLEADHPGAVALIAIGCGADANPSPRGTHEQAKLHGRTMADEVTRVLASGRASAFRVNAADKMPDATDKHPHGGLTPNRSPEVAMRRINPNITCRIARIDLPLGPLPSREDWEKQSKDQGVTGSRARYFLKMLDEGQEVPTTIPDYPVQTWCFGEDLAMVFLGGEVVVDYSIRMNDMFDSDRLWINAYSNDVPCYIASARVLREGGYEADSSMLYYRRPTRLAPETEDVICDAVQKLMPHEFYSDELQRDFPGPKSPDESLKCMTTKPDLRVVLAASEPLIRDPVAFDWDERGRLWVVEMGDYPGTGTGIQESGFRESQSAASPAGSPPESRIPDPESSRSVGRIRILEDTDNDGVYDKAITFLDGLAFPNGIHCWRGGAIITMAPDIFYAEDTDGDGSADVRAALYTGFTEGNQQHRVNGLRWGLDGWLYLANGDSSGEISGTGFRIQDSGSGEQQGNRIQDPGSSESQESALPPESRIPNPESSRMSLRGRDLRIHPDTNGLDTVSGQSQFGRERDDFGNWFGNNNSNPIWQYVLEDRYVRRNPHAGISQVTAPVSVIPGAAPVYPTSRTLARFNDFGQANRFTSACSTMIYRDTLLGEQYYGHAFTSEPVHNLVSRLVMTRDGINFKGERAADEQQSEFLASTDNWFRPTMIRTGPDGAIWVADMYRAVIEHPEWIPPEYQRRMNLYAGNDRGRIYRIVPASACCGEKAESGKRKAEETASASGGRQPSELRLSPFPISEGEGVITTAAQSPLSPVEQLITSATDPTGERVRVRGTTKSKRAASSAEAQPKASSPLIRPSATFSPDLGGEGTVEAASLTQRSVLDPPPAIPLTDLRTWFTQPWNEIPIADLVARLESPNGWWRDTAQRILMHRKQEAMSDQASCFPLGKFTAPGSDPKVRTQALHASETIFGQELIHIVAENGLHDPSPEVRVASIRLMEYALANNLNDPIASLNPLASDPDPAVRMQLILSLGEAKGDSGAKLLGRMLRDNFDDETLRDAGLTSLTPDNISGVLAEVLDAPAEESRDALIALLIGQAASFGQVDELERPLVRYLESTNMDDSTPHFEATAALLTRLRGSELTKLMDRESITQALGSIEMAAANLSVRRDEDSARRVAAIHLLTAIAPIRWGDYVAPVEYFSDDVPVEAQIAGVEMIATAFWDSHGYVQWCFGGWNSYVPALRSAAISAFLNREFTTNALLDAVAESIVSSRDFDAIQRDNVTNHRNGEIAARARKLLSDESPTARAAVVEDFRSQLSNLKSDAVAGRAVFEKRCGICHRLQDVGKEIGADLSALKDRSTEALLTAVLDPNRAVEAKFLVYTVVTKDGLQHSGMLKGETGGSLTLIGSEGKELSVARANIEELLGSKRSLMPEGIEKDIPAQDLANVFAFVQSTGTPWKRFEGNSPQFVEASSDGTITLPASAAEIYGPSLVFEPKYGNLGYWSSTEDYTKWTFDVPRSGHWTVEVDFACDDGTAGSLIRLSTGTRMLTARVPGSGSWDTYQTWTAGTIDLHRGRGQLIITAPENPPFALMDLRAVRLIPPE